MNLKQIIEMVSKEKKHPQSPDFESFCYALDMDERAYDWSKFDSGLKGYFYVRWYCTDSWVGSRVYLLGDRPVAVSCQPGRKSNEEIGFLSKDCALSVRSFIEECMDQKEFDPPVVTGHDLTSDLGEGYKVEYGSQILSKEAVRESTGEVVKISKIWGGYQDIKRWGEVRVEYDDGMSSIVTTNDLIFKYGS